MLLVPTLLTILCSSTRRICLAAPVRLQSLQIHYDHPQGPSDILPQCLKPTSANGRLLFPLLRHHTATDTFQSQNNSRLEDLAGKVSALRGVTIDIYDNARDQGVIDSSVRPLTIRVLQPC